MLSLCFHARGPVMLSVVFFRFWYCLQSFFPAFNGWGPPPPRHKTESHATASLQRQAQTALLVVLHAGQAPNYSCPSPLGLARLLCKPFQQASQAGSLKALFSTLRDSVLAASSNGSLGNGPARHDLNGVFSKLIEPEQFRRIALSRLPEDERRRAPSSLQVLPK